MVRKQYFQLVPYQVLLIVVNAVNGIVDGIFASNIIGQTAIGMFGPFNHFLYAVSMMLVSGSQILCGRYMGKNRARELSNVFSVDLAVSALISVATALLMTAGAAFHWTRLFAPAELERTALNEYFLGQAIGIPGLILGQQLFAFLSMENQTRRTMMATLACVGSNALADLLLVRVLGLGTFGLARGTSVSEWVFFAALAAWYLRGKSEMKLTLKGLDWWEAGAIMALGYPGSLSRFMEMFRCIIVNGLILNYVGSVGFSSFAASNSVMAIFWALPFSMMAVDRMLLSLSAGEEDREGILNIMRVITCWGVLFIAGVAVLIALAARPLTRLFFQDPADPVFMMTVTGLRMLPFCMPFSVVNQAFSVYAQIMEKRLYSTLLPILNGMLFVVLFSLILIPALGMTGLYLANILNGVCCLLTVICFSAAEIRRVPENMTDLLAFPQGFGAEEGDYLEFSVRDETELSDISQRVEEFCLNRGIDRRRAVFSGLAMEEMAGNVFSRGFIANRADRRLEIRVTRKGESVILRLRYSGASFDPSAPAGADGLKEGTGSRELLSLMDSAKEVQYQTAVLLARGISREIRYKNVLGLNVLMVRI